MKVQSTLYLLLAVLIVGGFLWFLEAGAPERDEHAQVMNGMRWEEVHRIDIDTGTWRAACIRVGDGWNLVRPIRARADQAMIEALLMTLERMESQEIITADDRRMRDLSLIDYELEKPRALITAASRDREWQVCIGSDKPTLDGVYVLIFGESDVHATASQVVADIPASVQELRDRRVLHTDLELLTRVDVERPDQGFVRLVREDGRWLFQQPVVARANLAKMGAYLKQAMALKAEAFVWDRLVDGDGDAAPFDAYGLDAEEALLTLSLWENGKALANTLVVGKALEDGSAHYARVSDMDSVFTLSADAVDAIRARGVASLRDRRVFELDPDRVTRVHITEGEQRLALRRIETGWEIVEPVRWPADADLVDGMLRGAAVLQVHTFTNLPPGGPSEAGLEPPRLALDFVTVPENATTGALTTNSLRVGTESLSATTRPASTDAGESMFMLQHIKLSSLWPDAVSDRLRRRTDPLAYRDRVVLAIDPANIASLRVDASNRTSVVERGDGDDWSTGEPDDGTVNTNAVRDLLVALAGLRASRVEVHAPEDLMPFGLDESTPTVTVGLRGMDGIQKKLIIGDAAPRGGYFAMVQGQDLVFVLSPALHAWVARPLTDPRPEEPEPEDE